MDGLHSSGRLTFHDSVRVNIFGPKNEVTSAVIDFCVVAKQLRPYPRSATEAPVRLTNTSRLVCENSIAFGRILACVLRWTGWCSSFITNGEVKA
ncbi:hypothetical protein LSCM4_03196 [Leishmania orientalis]|uniref:Uncharacterized protein n=1 Tax=Leishmania orientalis TaxID=2249476 RepID=A0A836GTM5_9TRYP|nr:hypothetical protein LSCM4_03196 [Leishmania orientalis]